MAKPFRISTYASTASKGLYPQQNQPLQEIGPGGSLGVPFSRSAAAQRVHQLHLPPRATMSPTSSRKPNEPKNPTKKPHASLSHAQGHVAAALRSGYFRHGPCPSTSQVLSWAVSLALALRLTALSSPLASAQDHSTDELHKFNESVDALIKKASPSVVQILVTGYGTLDSSERGNTGVVI